MHLKEDLILTRYRFKCQPEARLVFSFITMEIDEDLISIRHNWFWKDISAVTTNHGTVIRKFSHLKKKIHNVMNSRPRKAHKKAFVL